MYNVYVVVDDYSVWVAQYTDHAKAWAKATRLHRSLHAYVY